MSNTRADSIIEHLDKFANLQYADPDNPLPKNLQEVIDTQTLEARKIEEKLIPTETYWNEMMTHEQRQKIVAEWFIMTNDLPSNEVSVICKHYQIQELEGWVHIHVNDESTASSNPSKHENQEALKIKPLGEMKADWITMQNEMLFMNNAVHSQWTEATDGLIAHAGMGGFQVIDFKNDPVHPVATFYHLPQVSGQDVRVSAVIALPNGKFAACTEDVTGIDHFVICNVRENTKPSNEIQLNGSRNPGTWNERVCMCLEPGKSKIIIGRSPLEAQATVGGQIQVHKNAHHFEIYDYDAKDDGLLMAYSDLALQPDTLVDMAFVGSYLSYVLLNKSTSDTRLLLGEPDPTSPTGYRQVHTKSLNFKTKQLEVSIYSLPGTGTFFIAKENWGQRDSRVFTRMQVYETFGKFRSIDSDEDAPLLKDTAVVIPQPCVLSSGEMIYVTKKINEGKPIYLVKMYDPLLLNTKTIVELPPEQKIDDLFITPNNYVAVSYFRNGSPVCEFYPLGKLPEVELEDRVTDEINKAVKLPGVVSHLIASYTSPLNAKRSRNKGDEISSFAAPVRTIFPTLPASLKQILNEMSELKNAQDQRIASIEKKIKSSGTSDVLEKERKEAFDIKECLKELAELLQFRPDMTYVQCVYAVQAKFTQLDTKLTSSKAATTSGITQTVHSAATSVTSLFKAKPEQTSLAKLNALLSKLCDNSLMANDSIYQHRRK